MSLDRRVREELRQEAAAIEPDVERYLDAIEARAQRRNGVGATWLLVAAVIFAAIILRLPLGPNNGPSGPGPSIAPSLDASASPTAPASYPPIAGTYTTTFNEFDTAVERDGLGGTWTMRLAPTGAVILSPPAGFVPDTSLSGITYTLADDLFRTDLFFHDCNSVGNYRWSLSVAGDHLSFTSIDDACLIRETFLTRPHWLTSH